MTDRDLELLRLVGEQYAITLPQLATLIGRSSHAARWLRDRWQAAGWIEGRVVLAGRPVFMWLTRRGLSLVGLDYSVWTPAPGMLAHVEAVADVRISLPRRDPEAEWVSERELARQLPRGAHRPDALVRLDGREIAVEVELTQKDRRRIDPIIRELVATYPSVSYFTNEATFGPITEAAGRVGQGRVRVLGLPGNGR